MSIPGQPWLTDEQVQGLEASKQTWQTLRDVCGPAFEQTREACADGTADWLDRQTAAVNTGQCGYCLGSGAVQEIVYASAVFEDDPRPSGKTYNLGDHYGFTLPLEYNLLTVLYSGLVIVERQVKMSPQSAGDTFTFHTVIGPSQPSIDGKAVIVKSELDHSLSDKRTVLDAQGAQSLTGLLTRLMVEGVPMKKILQVESAIDDERDED